MPFFLHLLFDVLHVPFMLPLQIVSSCQMPLLGSVSFLMRLFISPSSPSDVDAEFEHSPPRGLLVLEVPAWGLPGVQTYHILGNSRTDRGK